VALDGWRLDMVSLAFLAFLLNQTESMFIRYPSFEEAQRNRCKEDVAPK
jgi:hypothetical protein